VRLALKSRSRRRLHTVVFCLEGRCSIHLSYGRNGVDVPQCSGLEGAGLHVPYPPEANPPPARPSVASPRHAIMIS
jgi:hypothetical protein